MYTPSGSNLEPPDDVVQVMCLPATFVLCDPQELQSAQVVDSCETHLLRILTNMYCLPVQMPSLQMHSLFH